PADSSLDLIDNELNSVLVCALAKSRKEPGGSGQISTVAECRFDNEGCGVVDMGDRIEDQVQFTQCIVDGIIRGYAEPDSVRERPEVDTAHQRAVARSEFASSSRHRGSADGPAVEAAVESDNVRFPRRHPRQSNGGLDRF